MTLPHAKPYDVAIVGGSYVGLALAVALSRASRGALRVAVIDAGDLGPAAASADPRASALTAASRRLLDALGVWPSLAAGAQAIAHIDVTDSALDAAVRPHFLHFDTEPEAGAPAAHMVENQALRSALLEAMRAADGVTAMGSRRVARVEVGRAATLEFDDGARLEARLLVAADGRRSLVRRAVGIKSVGWRYGQAGIVTTVAHERPHEGRAVQHFLPAGPFAILPLKGDRSSLVWTERQAAADRLMALDDAAFLAELGQRFGRRLGRLTLAGPRAAFPLQMHLARTFVADRVALAGDAAHVVHPLAGQGLNIGLRDVAALTEVVVEAARLGLDIGTEPVLRRYQRWRRFDSAFSGLAMDALNRMFSNDSAPLRLLRTVGLGLVDRAPALKQAFVQEAAGTSGEVPRLLKGEAV